MRQGRIDELPFQEHGTGRSLYPADKVSIAGQCDVKVGQVHMVSLQNEVTIVELVLENLAAKVDPIAPFFPG